MYVSAVLTFGGAPAKVKETVDAAAVDGGAGVSPVVYVSYTVPCVADTETVSLAIAVPDSSYVNPAMETGFT